MAARVSGRQNKSKIISEQGNQKLGVLGRRAQANSLAEQTCCRIGDELWALDAVDHCLRRNQAQRTASVMSTLIHEPRITRGKPKKLRKTLRL